MPNKSSRVEIPRNIEELLTLANKVYVKHQVEGPNSPLNLLQDYNWNAVGPGTASALAKHEEAETLRRQAEKAYEERDYLIGDISDMMKATRDLLKATNAKNPKKIGDWGFEVSDTQKAAPQESVKV